MRVVLDTNVLIAALISRGVCSELLEHCVLNHVLVTSEFILGELHEQLVKKFKYDAKEASEALALLRSQMEHVTPVPLETQVCRDADDDQVLGTAIAGKAICIVTGDNDLLVLQRFKDVEILNPAAFAAFEKSIS
jgi:putative PIN family toxin of toxin-antitoxin system